MSLTGAAHWTAQFNKTDGTPYSGVRVFHYEPATTTTRTAWSDEAATSTVADPFVGDTKGRASFYGKGNYRLLVKSSVADGDLTLYDFDPVKLEDQPPGLRGELQATSYPSATAANRGLVFFKVSAGGDVTEIGVNLDASGFSAFQLQGTALTTTQAWAKGADIASASTLTLGADGNTFDVTGAVTITAISSKSAGTLILLQFDGSLTLTHNGTSLICPSAANIQTVAGDMCLLQSEGSSNWRVAIYQRKSGQALIQPVQKYIYGHTYANNAGDAVNDLDIAAGGCMDGTGAQWFTTAALTKRSDATFVVGTAQGMLDTGAVGNNDYYLFAIYRSDTQVSDYLCSLSSTSPTMPASYTHKRLIGWFKRVGGTIVACDTYETEGGGLELTWKSPTLDVDTAALTTSRRTDAVKVPLNFSTIAHLNVKVNDAAASYVAWIYCPDQTDVAPSNTVAPLGNHSINSAAGGPVQQLHVRTSATGTIAARAGAAIDIYRVVTVGFTMARRT